MSKAFVREDAVEEPRIVPARAPLPPGVPNYVTARGLELLQAERAELQAERARLEQVPADAPEREEQLAGIAHRLAELDARIATATVVDTRGQPRDQVRFGAWVTVRTAGGEERRYRIVGVDEADAAQGLVSFLAPIARAVLGRQLDDTVSLETARGAETLEIVDIEYDDGEPA